MIVCPVCEHSQAQGLECDICGKQLVAPRQVAMAVAPLLELEQTQYLDAAAASAAPHAQPVPELELTRFDVGGSVAPAAPIPELELNRVASVQVAVQPLPELEGHRLADPNPTERTPAPTGAVVCRYCRNVQAVGLICDRCGMRLPRIPAARPTSAKPVAEEDRPMVLHACGARTRAGGPCSSCGADVPLPG